MNQNTDIDLLISLCLSGSASTSEKEELEKWLNLSTANREMFERLKEIWDMPLPEEYKGNMEEERDRIWAAGIEGIESKIPPAKREAGFIYWGKFAAVFIIFLLVSWLFSQMIQINNSKPEAISWNVIVNPAGQRSSHLLPDGTKVWLNSESELKYEENFCGKDRLVRLKGEAFFKVAKNKKKSFIVETGEIQTVALGTSFNIKAYPENQELKISLLEGKVSVKNKHDNRTTYLNPGDEVVASNNNRNFFKQQFDYDKTFGWKEGLLIFDGANFTSFKNAIEKWYGVKVEVKGKAPDDWKIRARYQRENLNNILLDISFNKNIKFEIHDKIVLIKF